MLYKLELEEPETKLQILEHSEPLEQKPDNDSADKNSEEFHLAKVNLKSDEKTRAEISLHNENPMSKSRYKFRPRKPINTYYANQKAWLA